MRWCKKHWAHPPSDVCSAQASFSFLVFRAISSDFAAQAYTDGQGYFRVSIRPSRTVGGWICTNPAIAAGQWHPEFTDAIRFYGELSLQVKEANPRLRLDDIRAKKTPSAWLSRVSLT
jgi:hypothetical protein